VSGKKKSKQILVPQIRPDGRKVVRIEPLDDGGRVPPGRGRLGVFPSAEPRRLAPPAPGPFIRRGRSRPVLSDHIGADAALFVKSWEDHDLRCSVEVDWHNQWVIFNDGAYMVGYEFEQVRSAAAKPNATPQGFRRVVRRDLEYARHRRGGALRTYRRSRPARAASATRGRSGPHSPARLCSSP